MQRKQKKLGAFIANSDEDIQWDSKGNIISLNNKDFDGNIVDLMKHSIRKLKTNKPENLKDFKMFLKQASAPHHFLHKDFYSSSPFKPAEPTTLQRIGFDPVHREEPLTPPQSMLEAESPMISGVRPLENKKSERRLASQHRGSTPKRLSFSEKHPDEMLEPLPAQDSSSLYATPLSPIYPSLLETEDETMRENWAHL